MLLFVGLGNPGDRYRNNRHNVGFMVMDALAAHYRFGAARRRFDGLIAEGHIAGTRTLLLKPQTYMNESGRSVAQAVRFYKLPAHAVTVFYDELDLALFKVRVKHGGGAAGHNGIRSLDAHMPRDYRRVRIGISHPGDKAAVSGHVLKDFAKDQREPLAQLIEAIVGAVPHLVDDNDAGFSNALALAMQDKHKDPGRSQGSGKRAARDDLKQERS